MINEDKFNVDIKTNNVIKIKRFLLSLLRIGVTCY